MSINTSFLAKTTQDILNQSERDGFYDNHENYDILINTIIDHNHLYYIDNSPIIGDQEYDKIFSLLKKFESLHPEIIRDDSPTQQLVGQYEVQSGFEKVNHISPILSLQNTYSSEEIQERHKSILSLLRKKSKEQDIPINENLYFEIEPKYDGLSIVLRFENGTLQQASTRGDGYTGDDVTTNVRTIRNIPRRISYQEKIIVRGEVIIPKSQRTKLNKERKESGLEEFSNTRNAASGSLKTLDTNEVAKRGLACYVYDVLMGPHNAIEEFDYISPLESTQRGKLWSIEDILSIVENPDTKEKILQADIDFDGLVIKLHGQQLRELLGHTNHHPRRAFAYKFPAQQASSQIQNITRQVGRTGILTPVAHITSIKLSGANISRVTLHNRDFIHEKDIRIGDWVRVQRSGEVIPYIVAVITQRRTGKEAKIDPHHIFCPACGTQASVVKNQVGTKRKTLITTQLRCPNEKCPGILKEQLKHFVSKNAMDIASLGDATLELLVDQGLLHGLQDIYTLTEGGVIFVLKKFPGIGDKKIDTFVKEIEASKHNTFWRLLNALGIPGIGIKLAKEIEKSLSSYKKRNSNLQQIFDIIAEVNFLSNIYGMGEKNIYEIQHRTETHQELLRQLDIKGIKPQRPGSQQSHKTGGGIAITGSFPISRSKLQYHIQQAGFSFDDQLKKTTRYLLVGENPGSKLGKAGENTTILTKKEDIYSLLHISNPLFQDEKTAEANSSEDKQMQSLF